MPTIKVLRQRPWQEPELRAAGFKYFNTRKRLVMAKVLTETRDIEISLETLVASSGDIICYDPGTELRADVEDYDHWPIRSDLFRQTYRPWDEAGWKPNPQALHLMRFGCRPFYKVAGVWAQRLRRSIYIQSLESSGPVLIPAGRWLCVGNQGEPYHMSDEKFRARYVVDTAPI